MEPMEYASIEREIHIDASPEVVFEVVSRPEHLSQWWPDEVELGPGAGSVGSLVFGDRASGEATVVPITVVAAEPPRRFVFRWINPADEPATAANSLLVTFELVPSGEGTLLRLTETGFREQGWELAVLEECYRDHSSGWDFHLARLAPYVDRLVSA
jgi:uncharacterized protein YndB with AHSA1/START domain